MITCELNYYNPKTFLENQAIYVEIHINYFYIKVRVQRLLDFLTLWYIYP